MKPWIYLTLIIGLVPLQTTVLRHLSIGDVRPDLCLIAALLTGILAGEVEGTLLGLTLGFIADLFSPGTFWLNMLTKGAIGLAAGIAGRHLANQTPVAIAIVVLVFSALSGATFLLAGWPTLTLGEALAAVRTILLPQALLDAALASAGFWLLTRRRGVEERMSYGTTGFRG
jgi:rod shape-determining protein MreD